MFCKNIQINIIFYDIILVFSCFYKDIQTNSSFFNYLHRIISLILRNNMVVKFEVNFFFLTYN